MARGSIATSLEVGGIREVKRVLEDLEDQLGPAKATQAYRAFAGEIRKQVRRRVPRSQRLTEAQRQVRGGAKHIRQTTKVVMVQKRPRVYVGATPKQKWAFYSIIIHQGRASPTKRQPVPFMAEGVKAGWRPGLRKLDAKAQQIVAKANRRVNVRPIKPGNMAQLGRPPDWRRGDFHVLWGDPKQRAAKRVRRK